MNAVLLSLLAAGAYGVSDFVGGLVSRRVSSLRLVLVSYPISTLLLLGAALIAGGALDAASVVWAVVSGVFMAYALRWFYAALALAPMSVVSPVTAILTAGLPVLIGLAIGERPNGLALVGVAVAVIAIVLVGLQPRAKDGPALARFRGKAVWLTVGAGTFFAFGFTAIHAFSPAAGLWPLVVGRAVSALVTFGASAVERVPMRADRRLLASGALLAVFDAGAVTAALIALHSGLLSLVSVVVSLYPAITVVLAVVFLRERLARVQIAGLVLAGGAIALIAAAG